jgi:hypothetical protein
LDIRFPLGISFSLYGVILSATGVLATQNGYERSVGINVNLIWGLVLLAFGALMFSLAWFGKKRMHSRR